MTLVGAEKLPTLSLFLHCVKYVTLMTLLPQSFITSSVTFDFYFPWHFWVRQNLFWPSFSQCSWQLRAGAPGVSASCLFDYWRGLDSRRLRLLQCLVPFEWLWLFSSIMDFFKLLLWSSCCNLICSHSHDHALTTYLLWIPHSSIFFLYASGNNQDHISILGLQQVKD